MKTIEFMGVRYQVEDWVNWAALDGDGIVFGYEVEPDIVRDDYDGFYFTNKKCTKVDVIGAYPAEKLAAKV